MLVEVTWRDSTSLNFGWCPKDSYLDEKKPVTITTVGHLLHRDTKCVVVALNRYEDSVTQCITIPRGCVIRIRRLT